ncbi:MAG: DUF4209 domain-containing protein [Candidatus Andersenbacteria bacterium]|nr:DUF4209 domain-containing protein [Candidatus Andersenbacteria bacterium]
MIRTELQNYLEGLETSKDMLDEVEIGQEISKILKPKNEKLTNEEEIAEYIAFHFLPKYPDTQTSWGTYYGPLYILPNEKGQYSEFPSIQGVNTKTLEYWENRANQSQNPLLVGRYADLVFDLSAKINSSENIKYQMARKVIDSTITICEQGLADSLDSKQKLERALSLSKQINDKDRINKIKETIINTERRLAEDTKPGTWGYSFEWLVLHRDPKVVLSEEEEKMIISSLAERLERLTNTESSDPWKVECAVNLLADFYALKKDEASLNDALSKLEQSFRSNSRANSDGLLLVNYLERLREVYSRYLQFQFAKDAMDRITAELSNVGSKANFDMKEISAEVKVKQEDIDRFLFSIFGDDKDNKKEIEEVVSRLVVSFVPKKDELEKQFNDPNKQFIFRQLGSNMIVSDKDGFPIAKFGPVSEDYDSHLGQYFSENLHFQSVFLNLSFVELRKKYTPESLYEFMGSSALFLPEDKDYILKILNAFWNKDFLYSGALMVPLIEDTVRNVFRINKLSFIKPNSNAGYDVLPLYDLLNHGVIKAIFGSLGENIEYYFKSLLTSRIGWNLRNNFAHGINKNYFASPNVSNRLLHVLLCLSLIRKNK